MDLKCYFKTFFFLNFSTLTWYLIGSILLLLIHLAEEPKVVGRERPPYIKLLEVVAFRSKPLSSKQSEIPQALAALLSSSSACYRCRT